MKELAEFLTSHPHHTHKVDLEEQATVTPL